MAESKCLRCYLNVNVLKLQKMNLAIFANVHAQTFIIQNACTRAPQVRRNEHYCYKYCGVSRIKFHV